MNECEIFLEGDKLLTNGLKVKVEGKKNQGCFLDFYLSNLDGCWHSFFE